MLVAALVVALAGPVRAADDPKRVAHDALAALVRGDAAAFANVTLPADGVDVLLRSMTPAPDRKAQVEEQLERVNLSTQMPPLFRGEPVEDERRAPVGTRIVYITQLGGGLVPVVVVKTEKGWMVEPRYWVAERLQAMSEPDMSAPATVAKRFLFHIVNDDTDDLKKLTTQPDTVDDLTRNNSMAGADRGHVAMLCMEMPASRARAGETVRLPGGTVVTASDAADDAVVVALLGSVEVPFMLKRVKGQWKVVPQPYFEWLRTIGSI
ncbi:MAG TPA: hypothetical protein VMF13_14405 [Luteitalea sp.]|nr:hypothetical protein [Luteitalea sp.]